MMTDEQSKAVQEVAKTGNEAIKLAEKAGGFITKLVGPTFEDLGGMVADTVKFHRFKNLSRIADKVEAIQAKRLLERKPTQIPIRVAIPMLESAALEDDDSLQDIWARLIANASDPGCKVQIHVGFVDVIKQISPDEALIIESLIQTKSFPLIFSNHIEQQPPLGLFQTFSNEQTLLNTFSAIRGTFEMVVAKLPIKNKHQIQFYLENLTRLRILELGSNYAVSLSKRPDYSSLFSQQGTIPEDKNLGIPPRQEFLTFTSFGKSFIQACVSDSTSEK